MKHFEIFVENKPGSLANICEILSKNAINIKSITTDGVGIIRIVTEDENTTREALKKSRFRFNESEILPVKLIDRPGELSKIARILARNRINIDAVYILDKYDGTTEIALKVNDMEKAKKILG